MRYITEGVVDTLNDFEKETHILDQRVFPHIIVEKSDKYKLFKFAEGYSESVNMIKFVLSNLIYKECLPSYWKCINIHIYGINYVSNRKYFINSELFNLKKNHITVKNILQLWNLLFDDNSEIIIYEFVIKFEQFNKNPIRHSLNNRLRLQVFERDNYKCKICGATVDDGIKLQVDHIVPVSKGGTDDLENLQTLCHKCNLGKSNSLDFKCTQNKFMEDTP